MARDVCVQLRFPKGAAAEAAAALRRQMPAQDWQELVSLGAAIVEEQERASGVLALVVTSPAALEAAVKTALRFAESAPG